MDERTFLNPSQAKEIRRTVILDSKTTAGRSVPMPLPRSDFWTKVGQLLDTIEMEIHEVYKTVGPSLKMQTMQKSVKQTLDALLQN